jgi:tetratricopeptide (TPR) repeat protein
MRLAYGRPTECTCDLCVFGDIVPPKWAHAGGQRRIVNAIVEQVGERSLEDFAARLGFADGSVDGWVKVTNPSRPQEPALEALAAALADLDPAEPDARAAWLIGLRWRFALAAIADKLSSLIGRPNVLDLGWWLERCFFVVVEFLRHSELDDDLFYERMLITLALGVRDPGASHILNDLRKWEGDGEWGRIARTAGSDWFVAVRSMLSGERSKERVAEILAKDHGLGAAEASLLAELLDRSSDELIPPALVTTALARSTVMAGLAHGALNSGDKAAAVAYLEGAVAEDPLRAELHQDLGALLGMLGRYDEGLAACERATELRPGWSPPLIQVGILLLDAGRETEALNHLEAIATELPWSVTLGHNLGIARLRTSNFERAVEALERVVERDPAHALALDALAHCLLELREWERGRELAKRAHSLGVHQTYRGLRAGRYVASRG